MRLPTYVFTSLAVLSVAPAAAAQVRASPEARVVSSRGDVEVTPPDAPLPRRAAVGDTLTRGARLRVGDGGLARVALPNGAELTLLPGASLVLFTSGDAPVGGRPASTTTTLESGVARVSPAPEGRPTLPLSLGATTVHVGRALATLSAARGAGMARVSVHQGRMVVRTGAASRPLRAGQGTREAPVGPRAPIATLPGAPAWRQPPPARVASLGGAAPVTATFAAPAAAAGWRVELARDPSFTEVVTSERVNGREGRWEGRVEGGGEWYARVSAVDALGLEGPASPPARFTVETPGVVPGAPASPGSPARPTVLRVPEGVYCGVDGASLARMPGEVRLLPARAHRIRCAADAEGTRAQEFTVSAEEAGPLQREVRIRPSGGSSHVLSVRLADLDGHPIPYAAIAAQPEAGVELGELREASERGVYTAPVRWTGARQTLHFRLTVNGGLTFEEDVATAR